MFDRRPSTLNVVTVMDVYLGAWESWLRLKKTGWQLELVVVHPHDGHVRQALHFLLAAYALLAV